MRRVGSALLLGLLLLPGTAPAQAEAPDRARPNVVLFLVDDLGWQDLSQPMWVDRDTGEDRPTPFNGRYRTPTVEALAARGVRFDQAYSCAVCSPTRTSLLSGMNAARHRVTQWTLRPGRDPSGKTPRLASPADWRVDGWQPPGRSLARVLRDDAGYVTIHAGKAHWGAAGTPGADPRKHGFDVNIAGHHAGAPSSYLGTKGFGAFRDNQEIWTVPGLEAWHGKEVHLTDVTTELALDAVDRALDEGKPFFLYLAHYAVHTPIEPHDPLAQPYRDAGLDETEARYASMIEGVDRSLGRVIAHLEERGAAERTIVAFTSDNGGLTVHTRGATPMGTGRNTHNLPLRAGKGSAYEGGTRVPLVVAWARRDDEHPAQQRLRVTPGIVRHEPVIVEDLFPTVLRWAGVTLGIPQSEENVVDGHDWTELLGPQPDQPISFASLYARRPLLFHYPHVWGPKAPGWGYEPHSAMRLGDWKVIYFYQPRRWELYELSTDLGEQHDLAAERPEKLRAMATRMVAELEELGAQWPTHRKSGLPEPPIFVHADFRAPAAGTPGADATPLVFVHGWSGDRGSFRKQVEHFAGRRPCLAVDLPGHGQSVAPCGPDGSAAHTMEAYTRAIADAMDRHGLGEAVLVGHSNGAIVAREFLRRHPERVAGVVSLDGSLQRTLPAGQAEQFATALLGDGRDEVLHGIAAGLKPADATAEDVALIQRGLFDTPAAVQAASLRIASADAVWEALAFGDVPLLAVHAAQPTWTDAYLEAVRALGDDVRIEVWAGVSHFLHWDRPDALHALIEEWLAARGR